MEKKKAENKSKKPSKKLKKIDYNLNLRIIFLILSIVKINIFNIKRNSLLVIDDFIVKIYLK